MRVYVYTLATLNNRPKGDYTIGLSVPRMVWKVCDMREFASKVPAYLCVGRKNEIAGGILLWLSALPSYRACGLYCLCTAVGCKILYLLAVLLWLML